MQEQHVIAQPPREMRLQDRAEGGVLREAQGLVPFGDHLFDQMTDGMEQYLADGEADGSILPSSDRRMLAALLATFGLATLVFERHIGRAIGEPGLTQRALQRMMLPALEYSTNGIFATDDMLTAAREAMKTD